MSNESSLFIAFACISLHWKKFTWIISYSRCIDFSLCTVCVFFCNKSVRATGAFYMCSLQALLLHELPPAAWASSWFTSFLPNSPTSWPPYHRVLDKWLWWSINKWMNEWKNEWMKGWMDAFIIIVQETTKFEDYPFSARKKNEKRMDRKYKKVNRI